MAGRSSIGKMSLTLYQKLHNLANNFRKVGFSSNNTEININIKSDRRQSLDQASSELLHAAVEILVYSSRGTNWMPSEARHIHARR